MIASGDGSLVAQAAKIEGVLSAIDREVGRWLSLTSNS